MFFKCCSTSQSISPQDFLFKNAIHKYIQVKNNKMLHFLHINSNENINELVKNDFKKEKENLLLNDIKLENFNELIESKKFNLNKINNLIYLNGFDTFEFSIIYKNKLDKNLLHLTKNEPSNLNRLPLLFFIHGVGGNSFIWRNQLNYFGNLGYEIIAIDLLGHGQSSTSNKANHYEFLDMCLDVQTVFDTFAKENNVIIGHSYGCSFACYLSQTRKDLVNKLILIAGGSPYPLNFTNPVLSTPLCCFKILKPLIDCHFSCSAFSSCWYRPDFSKEAFNISSKSLLYTMKGQYWYPKLNEILKVNQSVLLIEGENDKLVPFEDSLEMIKDFKWSYLVVIKNGSHMCFLEKPNIINNLIHLFLN